MSRASKTVRDALKYSQSGSGQFDTDEKYNFIRGKGGPTQPADVSQLLAQIESLEYDKVTLQDSVTGLQRNFDMVSRLLHEERLKVNDKEKAALQRNRDLEGMLKVETGRVKVGWRNQDLLDRVARLEKEKQQLEDGLAMGQKTNAMEVGGG